MGRLPPGVFTLGVPGVDIPPFCALALLFADPVLHSCVSMTSDLARKSRLFAREMFMFGPPDRNRARHTCVAPRTWFQRALLRLNFESRKPKSHT